MKIDPNSKSSASDGIFGLPYSEKQSKVIYLPVPWDVTTSYKSGTHDGPKAILKASDQIDFFDLDYEDAYEHGLFMKKALPGIVTKNRQLRSLAEQVIDASEEKIAKSKKLQNIIQKINQESKLLNEKVEKEILKYLNNDKIPVLVGGDHSTPFGAISAYAKKYKSFGILHFDAHSDTREAYMGFEYSHASIIHNVCEKIPNVSKFVQVGIRDFCEQEYQYISNNKKFSVFFDKDIQDRKFKGESFSKITKEIVSKLPKKVYITFDIDGLDPKYCPHTGTPVPGGLSYNEAVHIIEEVVKSKREIIGLDLVEVTPSKNKNNEWDANVGMRLLYRMTALCLASKGLIKKKRRKK
jgi:agmatinase